MERIHSGFAFTCLTFLAHLDFAQSGLGAHWRSSSTWWENNFTPSPPAQWTQLYTYLLDCLVGSYLGKQRLALLLMRPRKDRMHEKSATLGIGYMGTVPKEMPIYRIRGVEAGRGCADVNVAENLGEAERNSARDRNASLYYIHHLHPLGGTYQPLLSTPIVSLWGYQGGLLLPSSFVGTVIDPGYALW